MLRAYPVGVKVADAASRYVVIGESGDEFRVYSEIGQRHGHIGLTASESGLELFCLRESQVARGGEPEHDLAECDYFCHYRSLLFSGV